MMGAGRKRNAYVAGSPVNPGKYLGFLHAGYGVGALLSPLISTLAISAGLAWWRFYFVSFGLALFNTTYSLYAFYPTPAETASDLQDAYAKREIEMQLGNVDPRVEEGMEEAVVKASGGEPASTTFARRPAMPRTKSTSAKPPSTMAKTLKLPFVWTLAVFLFFTVGYETTTGGWIVTFLLRVRNANENTAGYAASGFWGGLTAGRLTSAAISPYLSDAAEKHLVHGLIGLCVVLDLIVWWVPSVFAGAFATAIVPTSVMVATKLLPRDVNMTALSFLSSSGSIGSAIWPFALGALASAGGVKVLQPFLLGILAVMGLLWTLFPTREGYPSNLKFGLGQFPTAVKGLFMRS